MGDKIERAEVYFGKDSSVEVKSEDSLEIDPGWIEVLDDRNGANGLFLLVPRDSLPRFRMIQRDQYGNTGASLFLVEKSESGACQLVKMSIVRCVAPGPEEMGRDVLIRISDREEVKFNPEHIKAKHSGDGSLLTLRALWDYCHMIHEYYDGLLGDMSVLHSNIPQVDFVQGKELTRGAQGDKHGGLQNE